MALIQWNESFSVNVVEIDRQHQKLVGMINDLHGPMREGKGKDVIEKIVSGLTTYSIVHFQTEEKYFEQFGYPDTDRHKYEHAIFSQKVSDYQEDVVAGKLGLTIKVLHFLSTWLQNHILKTDKAFSKFFNEKGLT